MIVTGSSGFVARHFLDLLVQNGYGVAPVKARFHSGTAFFWTRDSESGQWVERPNRCFPSDGVWVHLGALRGERPLPFKTYLDANVRLTRELLKLAARFRARKFILVSSVGVQGWPKISPISETVPPAPGGYYHVSKLLAERCALEASRQGLPVTIVRPALTYGPRERNGLIPKLIRMASRPVCFCAGNGKNRLHLIEVSDLADGLLKACLLGKTSGRIYTLAGPRPCTLQELLDHVRKNLGMASGCVPVPKNLLLTLACLGEARFRMSRSWCRSIPGEGYLPTFQQVRLLTRDRWYDIHRARSELGFSPHMTPELGIDRLLNWMQEDGRVEVGGSNQTVKSDIRKGREGVLAD
ncbi:MAG: NAD(P)-dependent oxidoreductase [Deltaproteobacteria bacterium]|nr:NAD(P)-dependent oxidoreductase [Deltaproteobacteria bacterium]